MPTGPCRVLSLFPLEGRPQYCTWLTAAGGSFPPPRANRVLKGVPSLPLLPADPAETRHGTAHRPVGRRAQPSVCYSPVPTSQPHDPRPPHDPCPPRDPLDASIPWV